MIAAINSQKLLIAIILSALTFLIALPVSAAYYHGRYTGTIVSKTGAGTLEMKPGEVKTVTVKIQNNGPEAWVNDGAGYISVYTYEPKYRSSDFDPGTWIWGDRPARMQESRVEVDDVATVSFQLKAPLTEGSYTEHFKLASENRAWVDGGAISFDINVANDDGEVNEVVEEEYSAEIIAVSAETLKLRAGKSAALQAAIKNTGDTAWNEFSLIDVNGIFGASGETIAESDQSVAAGGNSAISFVIVAPETNGSHDANLEVYANGQPTGEMIEIDLTVNGGSNVAKQVQETEQLNLVAEPWLRIGVLIVDEETNDEVVITSDEGGFRLEDINGTVLADLAAGEEVLAYYKGGTYYYDAGNGLQSTVLPLRFLPDTPHAVMRVTNFDRKITRNALYTDNEFRNILELRYNEAKERVWLINELKMEYYLRGLAETSNISPLEYHKALVTAARTFAYYHALNGTKWQKEHFTITAYSWDQVYKGYGQEERSPNIVQGVKDTEGMIVTYDGELAITPYFSRSDGRTRDWSDVWYGEKPWAIAVDVPCDAGKTMWGHGVGMSAQGALCMAGQGMDWEGILKHFYTGIDLTRTW